MDSFIEIAGHKVLVDMDDLEALSANEWRLNSHGYAHLKSRPRLLMHRILMGSPEGMCIDHINGNTLDNRKENLRICTQAENLRNRKMHSNNRTGVKGVYCDDSGGKRWRAQVRVDGRKICIGRFDSVEEARAAYDAAAMKYHGSFARTNAQDEALARAA